MRDRLGAEQADRRQRGGAARGLEELAAIQVELLVGDFGAWNVGGAFDQHGLTLGRRKPGDGYEPVENWRARRTSVPL